MNAFFRQVIWMSILWEAISFPLTPLKSNRQVSLFAKNKESYTNNSKLKRTNSSSKRQHAPTKRTSAPPATRPVLTDYRANRNVHTAQERLQGSIHCEHFESCSGCVVDNHVGEVDVIRQAKLYFSSTAVRRKRRDVIEGRKDASVETSDDGFYQVIVPSNLRGWRTQAKLAVAPKDSAWMRNGCSFGLFKRGTHTVLSIPNCEVHHPSINKAVHALVEATEKAGTPAMTDSRESGLRYVQFQVERTTGKISLTLVWNADNFKETQPSLSRLVKELNRAEPELWHSIWCNCNNSPGNNIFSRNPRKWSRISGPEFIREPLPVGEHGWLYFSPLCFRQGNMDGFDVLAMDVAQAVPGNSRVCELYGGVGLLGLTSLVYHHEQQTPLTWLRCSDENPANPRSFVRSLSSLPSTVTGKGREKKEEEVLTLGQLAKMMESGQAPAQNERTREKTSYLVASAASALRSGQALGANVLIVDPPRKGLEDEVLTELCKSFNPNQPPVESPSLLMIPDERVNWTNDVQKLIYVSCGFEALARDSEKLLSGPGGWILESATGYVLFPGSDHVETLCIFTRE